MQNYPHQLKAVPVAQDASGFSRDSAARDGRPAGVADNLRAIEQHADDEQTILWGDLFIDMRHLQRLAQATA